MQAEKSIARGFARWLAKAITPPLPRRLKRLIVISSIVGAVKHIHNPDAALINKLNRALVLNYKGAWTVSMFTRSLVWRFSSKEAIAIGTQGTVMVCNLDNCHLNRDEEVQVVDWFMQRMPTWLKYGSEKLMRHDIASTLSQLNPAGFP